MEDGVDKTWLSVWFAILWPILTGLPGLVAFVWAWSDRRERRRMQAASAEWRLSAPVSAAFQRTSVTVENRRAETLTLVAMTVETAGYDIARHPSDAAAGGSTVTLNVTIDPGTMLTPAGAKFPVSLRQSSSSSFTKEAMVLTDPVIVAHLQARSASRSSIMIAMTASPAKSPRPSTDRNRPTWGAYKN